MPITENVRGNQMRNGVLGKSTFTILAFVLCFTALGHGAGATAAQAVWNDVQRIVAVGDVHGDYDGYREVLEESGLINKRGNWIGGATHLVQAGDIPDRGPDTAAVIRHLQALEKQAKAAGGRVHALIGNHEALNILGDLRYVHPGEYRALKGPRARSLRQAYYRQTLEALADTDPRVNDRTFREQWMDAHPLGWVEHRQHWHPQGEFGSWVVSHNAVIKINGTLFVHGGLGPAMLDLTLQEINDQIRRELSSASGTGAEPTQLLADAEEGPLWYRGFAQEETDSTEAHLEAVLSHFEADRIVMGHTPGFGTILPRFRGRAIAIDSGISAHYGSHRAALLMENGGLYVLQKQQQVPLPHTAAEEITYLRTMVALNPSMGRLAQRLDALEAQIGQQGPTGSPVTTKDFGVTARSED